MKSTPGKIILVFLLFTIPIFANTSLVDYKLTTNKKSVHIKEPLLITFTTKQKDHTDNMFFSFNVLKSSDYEVKFLHKTTKDNGYHNSTATFQYILFALKEKTLHVNFDFVIKTASDKAVKQSYVDDHDDSVGIRTNNTKITLKPLVIKVEQLSKKVDLVGDFRLNSKIDSTQIDQYGAVNLHYTLKGTGYKEPHLNILNKKIKNVKIFSQVKDNFSKLTKKGYIINTDYIFALSAKKDFTIPAVTLTAYSPTKKNYYTLQTKAYAIKVKNIDTTKLIDKTNAPKAKSLINMEAVKTFFIYILVFVSGFLTAKLSQKEFSKERKKEKFEDIKNAKSAKELLMVLIMNYQNRGLDEYISKLEAGVNKKYPLNLNTIKKEIRNRLM